MSHYGKIAVLFGGRSAEREVSLSSGRECAAALERLGARVTRVDAGRDLGELEAAAGVQLEDGALCDVAHVLRVPARHRHRSGCGFTRYLSRQARLRAGTHRHCHW